MKRWVRAPWTPPVRVGQIMRTSDSSRSVRNGSKYATASLQRWRIRAAPDSAFERSSTARGGLPPAPTSAMPASTRRPRAPCRSPVRARASDAGGSGQLQPSLRRHVCDAAAHGSGGDSARPACGVAARRRTAAPHVPRNRGRARVAGPVAHRQIFLQHDRLAHRPTHLPERRGLGSNGHRERRRSDSKLSRRRRAVSIGWLGSRRRCAPSRGCAAHRRARRSSCCAHRNVRAERST